MTNNFFAFRMLAAAFALAAAPSIVMAQGAQPVNQGGPMVLEQVEQHFTIAPEFKVSTFDGETAQLVGAHAGVFLTKTVLIGGGFYTQANGSDGRRLTYGGVVVGWQPWSNGLLGLNVRGLVGLGRGTTTETVTLTSRDRRSVVGGQRRLSSDLFVAEPQVDVLVRLTKHLHLDVGGGYRFANASRLADDRFSGASGSVALRIGSAQ